MGWIARISRLAIAVLLSVLTVGETGRAGTLDPITIGTSKPAGAEQGGYYAAIASGSYRKYGLDVTIRRLEPGTDPAELLVTGEIDFSIDGNSFEQVELVTNDVPVISVAAIFQKDPIAVLAHPGAGMSRFEDLRGRTLFMSDQSQRTLWPWLQRRYRLGEGQLRPYSGDPGPFLNDPASVLVGDVIAETFAIASRGGFEPVVLLPADDVYYTYNSTIQTSWRLVHEQPDLLQRFVDATIEGWYRYLYDDNARTNALIKADNGDMADDRLAFGLRAMQKHGLVDSGYALSMGIGAMAGGRWGNFYKATLGRSYHGLPAFDRLYTLQFVNQGHGLAIKEALLGG
jgi:NitT/TauT family transport system substrate-binding protein